MVRSMTAGKVARLGRLLWAITHRFLRTGEVPELRYKKPVGSVREQQNHVRPTSRLPSRRVYHSEMDTAGWDAFLADEEK